MTTHDRDSGAAIVPVSGPAFVSGNGQFSDTNGRGDVISRDAFAGELAERATAFARNSRSPVTIRAYARSWRTFELWCLAYDRASLPATPETVALWITDLAATQRPATIRRHLAAVSVRHRAAGYPSPTRDLTVADTVEGITRTLGAAPTQKAPLRAGDVADLVDRLDRSTLIGARDWALLAVGFAGAFRRSELVALTVDQLVEENAGDWLRAWVASSKTDQRGEGEPVYLPWARDERLCPVRALRRWLDLAGVTTGPALRSVSKGGQVGPSLADRSVCRVVQRTAKAAGLNPDRYGGHSLRAGFVTTATEAGVSDLVIMRHTRHRSRRVMDLYSRDARLKDDNPARRILGD